MLVEESQERERRLHTQEEVNDVVGTPGSRQATSLCHVNFMKPHHGCVLEAAVGCLSSVEVEQDEEDMARVPPSIPVGACVVNTEALENFGV